jgi:O-antigen biosynthesis protein
MATTTACDRARFPAIPLRLLVLGRIDGGKGLELLRGALPELTRYADLHLLGCGKAGEELFGVSGVHIELDYPNNELPLRLARIRPHAALLLSTVAESFSYTLSELWSLGVVPIATRAGAFAERIVEGQTGLLFSPDARALIDIVRNVARDRTVLHSLHTGLVGRQQRHTVDMAEDYLTRFALTARPRQIDCSAGNADEAAMVELLDQTLQLRARTERSAIRLEQQQIELDRRASWGFALDRQLQERTQWARSLEQQLQQTRQQCADLQLHAAEVEQQTRQQLTVMEGALAESEQRRRLLRDRARERLREERRLVRSLAEQLADIAEDVRRTVSEQHRRERDFLAQLQTMESSRVELASQLARSEAQREELIRSSSWRITAPIRVFSRKLRQLAPGTAFRLRRLRGLLLRLESSLRSRGWRGTLARIREELRRRPPQTPAVQAPPPEEQFERLIVPFAQSPLVSIIIPVYGKLAYTVTCLKSLACESCGFGIEVIVVDDCSPDDSFDSLRKVEGIRLVRNEVNLGFIGACNAGAALAQGDYLCFLNNDTAVQAGWLDALMATFEQFPDCGLVGAKLIYPDGRLQEAGGIIFNDGAGWNYGRFDDPNDPRYDYPREVDYCSGAAIVLSRELFAELGGFDTHYAPAYYEDTDLAFKVRARGLKVYYQPASRVVHYEGISSGTDTSSGIKRFQLVNHEKFKQRWADALKQQPVHDGELVRMSCEHRVSGRILLIDATTPTPDQDSGSVRLMNLLRLLVQEHWKVVFFADNRAYVPGYTEAVKALGVEALYHPWLSDPVRFFRERGHEFDAVLICRHYIASNYLKLVREHCPNARFIFDTVDLHFLREHRAADVAGDDAMRRQAELTRRQELELIGASDVTVVVSPVEQALLAKELPDARVDVLSNIHEIAGRRREFGERKGIFFVGGFQHVPNVDAVMWFVSAVWGQIRASLPDLQFHIVGSKMPAEVRELAQVPGVVIEGFVESIDPFLDGCRMAVAPLRYGAGVKGKVNSSMAHGQPVVMTSVAAEGMFLEHGVHGLIADSPTDFAEQVIRLYQDEALWLQISDAGLQNVEENFSMQAARDALRKLLVG